MPAVGKAVALTRVQGIHSDISDLVLRNGKEFVVRVGGAVIPTPTLTRDMEASSSVQVSFYDPNLNFLSLSLLSEKFDAEIDGLKFRYLGASKSGRVITITLEDQVIARLRELEGPKKAYRSKVTRAEFIISLIEELRPEVPWFCPQLEEKQPIKSERQAKTAVKEAPERRDKGIGNASGLTMDGAPLSTSQRELAELAMQIAERGGAPFRSSVALIAALMTESSLGTAAPGNVLEALEPYTQIRGAADEISGFLFGEPTWTGVTAVGYEKQNPDASYYEIAQAVQKSGAGEASNGASNYGKFGDEARAIVEAFGGGTEAELVSAGETVKEPYTFTVGKKETYWTAIQRLAKEVNWRAFVVAGRFFFISEPELSRGMVRMAIDREVGEPVPVNAGIEDVDFDFNANKPVTEVTATALAKHWTPPPGSVVTLAGYGPASIGAGDAPPEKGKTVEVDGKEYPAPQLSSAVKASTHEGKGRYLVASVEAPLEGDPETRQVTITLRKPTQPLPEKAAQTKTLSPAGGTEIPAIEGGEFEGMGIYSGTAEDVVNEVIFYAQKHGFPDLTPASVTAANAAHGPTVSGTRSDHQGPPATAWAADISNGTLTQEEFDLATAIAKAFGIPWHMGDLTTHEANGYRLQLIHGCSDCGGDHTDHVHFGCEVV